MASVEITQTGRGGGIVYREDGQVVGFSWEFAMSPALVLVFGPRREGWDLEFPWAAGRQEAIYDFVGREIVRQKAPDYIWENDLDDGVLTIRRPRPRQQVTPPPETRAVEPEATGSRTPPDSREGTVEGVAALAALDTPEAIRSLEAATGHHLSAEVRLAAAEALHRKGRLPDLAGFVAGEIRRLDQPDGGMERALRLAEAGPTADIRQALLTASWNQTDCAPHCAALLLRLLQVATADEAQMLSRLGRHASYFERRAAFERLCLLTGLNLEG